MKPSSSSTQKMRMPHVAAFFTTDLIFRILFLWRLVMASHSSQSVAGEFGRYVALDFVAVFGQRAAVFDAGSRVACAGDGRVVETAACVRANLSEFGEALQAGLETYRAARHVVPAHGVFEHSESGAVRDEE